MLATSKTRPGVLRAGRSHEDALVRVYLTLRGNVGGLGHTRSKRDASARLSRPRGHVTASGYEGEGLVRPGAPTRSERRTWSLRRGEADVLGSERVNASSRNVCGGLAVIPGSARSPGSSRPNCRWVIPVFWALTTTRDPPDTSGLPADRGGLTSGSRLCAIILRRRLGTSRRLTR